MLFLITTDNLMIHTSRCMSDTQQTEDALTCACQVIWEILTFL